uniref:META domain-containing protein n=1 Tax=Fulvivirga sp. TaxID=1931237 RepID=UPI00404B1E9D
MKFQSTFLKSISKIAVLAILFTSCTSSKPDTSETEIGDTENNENLSTPALNKNEGFDFYATAANGNWSVDVFDAKYLRFIREGIDTINIPDAELTASQDGAVTMFRTKTGYPMMELSITQAGCKDDQATEELPYGVKILYQLSPNDEIITVEGCGSYVPDYRLSGTWQMVEIGAIKSALNSSAKAPFITFNISERTITGNNGCNTFRGEFSSRGSLLLINKMSSTKMACPGEVESEFMSALSDKIFYSIKNDTLHITDGEITKMKLVTNQ